MKFIKPSYEILTNFEAISKMTLEEYRHQINIDIERASRTCYKSEDKITEDSADKMVEKMIKSKHGSMLEHGTVYLKIEMGNHSNTMYDLAKKVSNYDKNKYSKVKDISNRSNPISYITTNLRVIVENDWLDDLQYLCLPTEYHEKRVTVKFIMDRIGSQSFCRHRAMSFAQESQRYCSYGKDKFGNEVTFIIPHWVSPNIVEGRHKNPLEIEDEYDTYIVVFAEGNKYVEVPINYKEFAFLNSINVAEKHYLSLVEEGLTAQDARVVLPNCTKTEIIMTGFVSDWQHFFNLRALGTTGKPHPEAKRLALPLMEEFKELKLIK